MIAVMRVYDRQYNYLGMVPDRGTKASLEHARKAWPQATKVIPDLIKEADDEV